MQRRDAFRVGMKDVPVYIDAPMEFNCELIDISILGARFDRELPCTPGIKIHFRIAIPSYGDGSDPEEMELTAEVVRVEKGDTGVRFVDLSTWQTRALRGLVNQRQRMILAAVRITRDRLDDGPQSYR